MRTAVNQKKITTSGKHNPALERDYAEWRNAVEETARKIEKLGSYDLDILEKAGVPRRDLLWNLAVTVRGRDSEYWKKVMRQRRDALKSLAGRIEALVAEADKAGNDPTYRVRFYSYTIGGGAVLGMAEPKSWGAEHGPVNICLASMRDLAKAYREEANLMSRYLRRYGQMDSGVVLLLVLLYNFTHSTSHFEVLGRLLTDASEVAGRKHAEFSADQLRKIWDRRGKNMLRIQHLLQTKNVGSFDFDAVWRQLMLEGAAT